MLFRSLKKVMQVAHSHAPACMSFFRQAGYSLARQSEVDYFRLGEFRSCPERGFHQRRPAAVIGDAIAQDCYAWRHGVFG